MTIMSINFITKQVGYQCLLYVEYLFYHLGMFPFFI